MLFRVVSQCTTSVIALLSGESAVLLQLGFGQISGNNGPGRTAVANTIAVAMAASTAKQLL